MYIKRNGFATPDSYIALIATMGPFWQTFTTSLKSYARDLLGVIATVLNTMFAGKQSAHREVSQLD